ncbi:hypothetical protein ACQGFJ_13155 [Rhodococcus sp. 3.70]
MTGVLGPGTGAAGVVVGGGAAGALGAWPATCWSGPESTGATKRLRTSLGTESDDGSGADARGSRRVGSAGRTGSHNPAPASSILSAISPLPLVDPTATRQLVIRQAAS